MAAHSAKILALDVFRQPVLARRLQRQPLPDGMLEVIKIAAGEGLYKTDATQDPHLQEAAVFFLQQVLMSSDHDKFRLLGLNPGASLELVREHRRWLLKWLHPDRNHNKWESTLFARVNSAARHLEDSHGVVLAQKGRVQNTNRRSPKRPSRQNLHAPQLMPKWRNLLRLSRRSSVVATAVLIGYLIFTRFDLNQSGNVLANFARGLGN